MRWCSLQTTAPFYGPFISRLPVRREHGCASEAKLPWSAWVWFGAFLPQQPSQLPSSHETGLAFCIVDFLLLRVQQGGVPEWGFITIITIFVLLYHVQTSVFPRASPLRTAEQFRNDRVLVFIRQFSILLSQPPNHEVSDIKTKQNSWVSFYAPQDLRCRPAVLSSSQALLFQAKAKIPVRPRLLLGVFSEHNPKSQDLTKFCSTAHTPLLTFRRSPPPLNQTCASLR